MTRIHTYKVHTVHGVASVSMIRTKISTPGCSFINAIKLITRDLKYFKTAVYQYIYVVLVYSL